MSSELPKITPMVQLLAGIPQAIREELLNEFQKILRNYREARWEPTELDGGRFCEVVYSILDGQGRGAVPLKAKKPADFYGSCKKLENADQSLLCRSGRIQIPRFLIALYEVRNNRGVGHVGGDVSPNYMDSTIVLSSVKWILAELVRIFHKVDTVSATFAVEMITERSIPLIWETSGAKLRVLPQGLSKKDEVLLLLYQRMGPVKEAELLSWTEHSNASVFRRDVIVKLHKSRLVDYDKLKGTVEISPTGISIVESEMLSSVKGFS